MTPRADLRFGKYRDLFLAIGLFLVLDLGVLFFNLYTSLQIGADASRINAAGELRVYSQQLTKALLTLSHELREEQSTQTSASQIAESHAAFARAFDRLKNDAPGAWGSVGSGLGNDAEGMEKLDDLGRQWFPLSEAVAPLLAGAAPAQADVDYAVNKAVTRNVRLMQQADDLSAHLEGSARAHAAALRRIQIGAILLATLNFVFIVFKFLRRLSESDRRTEAARRETTRILDTVREGLFLLERDGRVGVQRSASIARLLGAGMAPGARFLEQLAGRLAPEVHEAAEEYVGLLFNKRVKPALLEELNPLREIPFASAGGKAGADSYLTFEFTQVEEGGEVAALLVTVFDVTQKIRLQQELAGANARAESDVGLLLAVLDQEPAAVRDFLESAEAKLLGINRELEEVRPEARAYSQLVNHIFRMVHSIKGEAGALGLGTVLRQAHGFEERLAPLRRRGDLSGDDLIPLAVEVAGLREQLLLVGSVLERAGRARGAAPAGEAHPIRPLIEQIEQLALHVAHDLGKKVRFEAVLPHRLPEIGETQLRVLRESLPQIVRNAVAHGIEASEERVGAGKAAEGVIRMELAREAGGFTLSLSDDGRGISPEQLRQRALALGYAPERVEALDDRAALGLMFEPGFSTRAAADAHAGRGVGLDAVKAVLQQAGARLRVSTVPNAYTQFRLRFGT
jgi:HPt (histidine-containing phosphotransfer) domain-containing protein